MASILQRVGAWNQKAYTFSFGASAAAGDNAGPTRMPVGRPMVDFSKSFLGSSGFFLATSEQLQTSSGAKVPSFSVRATARDLIPRTQSGESRNGPPPYTELEMKQCVECKHNKPLVDFEKAGKGLRKACRACVAVTRAERMGKDMAHMSLSVKESWKRAKTCAKCGLVKEIRDFAIDKKAKDGAHNRCRACKSSYAKGERVIGEVQNQDQESIGQLSELSNAGAVTRDFQSDFSERSDFSESDYSSSEEDELTLERQFEVTKNIWETLLHEPKHEPKHEPEDEDIIRNEDIIIPDVAPAPSDPIYQQARIVDPDAASETIAALQVKLLRLDFDLSHARAVKAVFSDQVQYLERVMSNSAEENTKLRSALDEAVSSIAELESHVERLDEESRNLRGKLLRLDFDLTHTRATRTILGDKVEDLERAIKADNEASRIRDEKLSTALEQAATANATLRAQVEEAQTESSTLKSRVLNFSLNLDHAQFKKGLLTTKVEDLERDLSDSEEAFRAREEGVKLALDESAKAIAELERLRENHNALLSKSIRSDFDLEHNKWGKKILGEKVADLEKVVNDIREEDAILKAALAQATNSNTELEAQLAGLQEEANNLKIKVLKFSFDLTHSGFTKGLLTDQVKDLQNLVSEQEELAQIRNEKLQTALAEASVAVNEVKRLESEGGNLKSKLLRLDLDLAHARAHKNILGTKVEDLEKVVNGLRTDDETLRAALADAVNSNAHLEAEVVSLQLESTNLRNKVLFLSLDLAHAQAGKTILTDKVQDLERALDIQVDHAQTQEEKLKAAQALTAKLEAEVESLEGEKGKLRSQNLRQDFDLAHLRALKAILENRVLDIDNAIAARDAAEANMKEALAARGKMKAKLEQVADERDKFQTQVLRKDFDVTHLRAIKAILSDRVADLERVVALHADIGDKLKAANVDKDELAAEIERLREEGSSLQSKLLRKDFDMTHTRALKAILHTRVEDLERQIAEQNVWHAELVETKSDKAKLETDLQKLDAERAKLQSQNIRQHFDLQHVKALKALLEDKVSDLERISEAHDELGLKLIDATLTNAALEAEVQRRETQEGTLRSQLLARDFDLTHTRALKHILDTRVADLEQVIKANDDLEDKLTATKGENTKLVSEVQRLEKREGQLMSEKLRKEFDITHYRALMAILEGRVEDLQKVLVAHDELSEKLKASHLVNAELEAQVDHLGDEGSGLRRKLLLQDFDLTNTRALKKILNEKVEDLERVIANHDDMDAKLRASRTENLQLEGKVAQLVENEGVLQTKLVRKDFDLQHYHALKSILDDKVAGLEKALANLDEAARVRDEKLKAALADASASSAQNELLTAETSSLKVKLLNSDFDLIHAKAGKRILGERVQDLERVLANYDEVALARDASLAEALSSIEALETEVARLEQERGVLQVKSIRTDFDLAHAKATRAILGNKVVDLETQGEKLTSALTEAITTKTNLEGKVGQLSTGLKAVLKEERSLRGSQAELKRQLFNLQIDNQALERRTQARAKMLQEKQDKLAALERALVAAQEEAAALSRQLGVPVASGDEEKAIGGKETVGDQLAQIASLTASVQNKEGGRVQIAETDADTDNDDSDTGGDARPVVSEGTEDGGSGKGNSSATFATATFASIVILALGGALLLTHPTKALPQDSESEPAPVEQLVETNAFTPAENVVAGALKSFNPVEQVVAANAVEVEEEEEVEQVPAKQVAAAADTKPEVLEKAPVKQVEQIAAFVDTKPTEKVEERGSVNPVEQVAAVDESKEEEEVDPVEELALLEVAKVTRPAAEEKTEELSIVSELSSKLFDTDNGASALDKGDPFADVPSFFGGDYSPDYSSDYKPDCNVDMC